MIRTRIDSSDFLFGNEEYKEYALSLYNAVNGTEYTDCNDITFYTIEDVIYIKRKNDVAVLLDNRLSLWEHQSSYNPNMPLRGLIYFGQMYDKYISLQEENIYGGKLIRIPTPKYCVFYNGNEDLPSITKLYLSDAFAESDKSGEFEWTATMYNLNSGKNDDLLEKCKSLSGYMAFVNRVRENRKNGYGKEKSVDEAVTYCIKNDILKRVLLRHRSEVVGMVLTEFNEEVYRKGIYGEGYEAGQQAALINLVCKKLSKNKVPEQIAEELEEDPACISAICDVARKYAPDYDVSEIISEIHANEIKS